MTTLLNRLRDQRILQMERDRQDGDSNLSARVDALETFILENFIYAAYGGIHMPAPTAGPDLGLAYVPLDDMTEQTVPNRNVSVAPPGLFTTNLKGVWSLQVTVAFEHNSSNQGRITNLRFWNVTDGVAVGLDEIIGIGRNQEATTWSAALMFETDADLATKQIRLELGGGDAITGVVYTTQSISLFNVGEYRP